MFNYIGSFENIDFSRLGRARRTVFFEGNDKKLLKKFASKVGAGHFSNDLDTTILQAGGFGQWRRVKNVAWTFREVLKLKVDVFALFDRDYRSEDEVNRFLTQMNENGIKAFVLGRKEIENYALSKKNLIRVIMSRQRERLPENTWLTIKRIGRLIDAVSNRFKGDTFSQLLGHRIKFVQSIRDKIDPSTTSKNISKMLDAAWKDIDQRLKIISGKEFIAELSTSLQKLKGFSITATMLIDGMPKEEVPEDLVAIIQDLDNFCKR